MALSLDGAASATTTAGTQTTPTLTTAVGSGQIIALTYGGSGAGLVTSVTASGLTFTDKIDFGPDGNGNVYSCWFAPYLSNFSGTVTANWQNATAVTCLTAFGIGGADTSGTPFDGAGGSSASGSPSINTSVPDTFIFSIQADGFTPSPGAGWALIDPSGPAFFNTSEFKIVSSPQSGLVAAITGTSTGGIVLAVKAAPIILPGLPDVLGLAASEW